jgi:hypothetical protein
VESGDGNNNHVTARDSPHDDTCRKCVRHGHFARTSRTLGETGYTWLKQRKMMRILHSAVHLA